MQLGLQTFSDIPGLLIVKRYLIEPVDSLLKLFTAVIGRY